MIRTVTYDDSTHKLMPLHATEEINQAYYAGQRKHGFWNCSPVYSGIIAATPEYQDHISDVGKKDE